MVMRCNADVHVAQRMVMRGDIVRVDRTPLGGIRTVGRCRDDGRLDCQQQQVHTPCCLLFNGSSAVALVCAVVVTLARALLVHAIALWACSGNMPLAPRPLDAAHVYVETRPLAQAHDRVGCQPVAVGGYKDPPPLPQCRARQANLSATSVCTSKVKQVKPRNVLQRTFTLTAASYCPR